MRDHNRHSISIAKKTDAPRIAGIIDAAYPGSPYSEAEVLRQLSTPCIFGYLLKLQGQTGRPITVGFALWRESDAWAECYLSAFTGSPASVAQQHKLFAEAIYNIAAWRNVYVTMPTARAAECLRFEQMGAAATGARTVCFVGERLAFVYTFRRRLEATGAARRAGLDYIAALERMGRNGG